MKIRLLKRLRKEAHEIFGIAEIVTDSGCYQYIVGRRQYLKDYKEYIGSYTYCTFLTDAVKTLAMYRRSYILEQVRQIRRKEQEKAAMYRSKKLKKL